METERERGEGCFVDGGYGGKGGGGRERGKGVVLRSRFCRAWGLEVKGSAGREGWVMEKLKDGYEELVRGT